MSVFDTTARVALTAACFQTERKLATALSIAPIAKTGNLHSATRLVRACSARSVFI
jgi:hypothetical protein